MNPAFTKTKSNYIISLCRKLSVLIFEVCLHPSSNGTQLWPNMNTCLKGWKCVHSTILLYKRINIYFRRIVIKPKMRQLLSGVSCVNSKLTSKNANVCYQVNCLVYLLFKFYLFQNSRNRRSAIKKFYLDGTVTSARRFIRRY